MSPRKSTILSINPSALILLTLLLTLSIETSVKAHEFWIEPSTFQPQVDSLVKIGLQVGEPFQGEIVERYSNKILSFVAKTPHGEEPILGFDGQDPAGLFRIKTPGIHIISYSSRRERNQLDAEAFENYLKEDGLENISELRSRNKQTHEPGREFYSRCAKAIIKAGDLPYQNDYNRKVGLPLELIPERNPYLVKIGEAFPIRILYKNKPQPNILIRFVNKDAPEKIIKLRSDHQGRVLFPVDLPGMWLVAGVYMVPLKNEPLADWESFWASLTFEIL